ncbi:MAG TPA: hypothetical protein VJS67_06840 [Pseudonocardiaceae bacterium]|nr:hypothetical protein [Pseudonocardiaceae bacterium]
MLPAGITVLAVVVVASAWWLPSLRARSVVVDALASAVYAGNYRFALRGTDYLAADGAASPFQHYWSLGQAATAAGGGYYADLTSLFCTPSRCPVVIGDPPR